MSTSPGSRPVQSTAYFQGCNPHLLKRVPASALRVLDVGCGEGRLGAALKHLVPRRQVFGIERASHAAEQASQVLDRVLQMDLEAAEPDLAPGSIDCIVYGDVLEHLIDAEGVLRKHRKLLAPGGRILCSIPNIQHHSILSALMRGDLQYASQGLLDWTHLRFFTYATFTKLLLDAGYAPTLSEVISVPASYGFLQAARSLAEHVGASIDRTTKYLDAFQYVFEATAIDPPEAAGPVGAAADQPEPRLTVVACVTDEAVLEANLLSSPCLRAPCAHQVILLRGCKSAAEGYNRALAQAEHPLVVFAHQDVYLPLGWPGRLARKLVEAERLFGPLGPIGVFGARWAGDHGPRSGYVVDRDTLLGSPHGLPAAVETLDELVLVLRKDTPLRFDARLGFHFYGADIGLQAVERGLQPVVIDALCFHNSLHAHLSAAFYDSARSFAKKWSAKLPVATSVTDVTEQWLRDNQLRRPWPQSWVKVLGRQLRAQLARRAGREP